MSVIYDGNIFKYKEIKDVSFKEIIIPLNVKKLIINEKNDGYTDVIIDDKILYKIEDTWDEWWEEEGEDRTLDILLNLLEDLTELEDLTVYSHYDKDNCDIPRFDMTFPQNLKKFCTNNIIDIEKLDCVVEYIQCNLTSESEVNMFPKSLKELICIDYDHKYNDFKIVYKNDEILKETIYKPIKKLFDTTNLEVVYFYKYSRNITFNDIDYIKKDIGL